DLCTIGIVDKLIKAGISIFKIEGRARSPDYVYTVTKTYKEAIDSINNKTYSKDKIKTWEKELKTVFNRGFWNNGYYLGKKLGEWANSYGNKATKKKKFIGICLHYFTKKKIGYFNIQTSSIKLQDEILITGPTTGIVKEKINSIVNEKKSIEKAKKGDLITIPIKEKIRKNDKLFLIK
ncbi:collagenase-like protease, partial [archaeon]|nr:collagenase-like protease [archaeon]